MNLKSLIALAILGLAANSFAGTTINLGELSSDADNQTMASKTFQSSGSYTYQFIIGSGFNSATVDLFEVNNKGTTSISNVLWTGTGFSLTTGAPNSYSFDGPLSAGNYSISFNYNAAANSKGSFSFIGGESVTSTGVGQSPSITAAVPEPETYAMMLAGLGALGFVGRRRKAK
ncbi:MAG: FxDxF family PEP-CTERM protein [Leptothrix sp. (in: b-proteobacteria)]